MKEFKTSCGTLKLSPLDTRLDSRNKQQILYEFRLDSENSEPRTGKIWIYPHDLTDQEKVESLARWLLNPEIEATRMILELHLENGETKAENGV